ncbi:MAG: hypothetical protein CMF55_04835 [Legionellales bacterium]|nr:hypothetical protein [Legionellales bacterium]
MRRIRTYIFIILALSLPLSQSSGFENPTLSLNADTLVNDIQQANNTIQIATYSAYLKNLWSSHDPVIAALENAQRRGVNIEIQWNGFKDNIFNNQTSDSKQSSELKWCQYHHISCHFPSKTRAYYHRKFMIIDDRISYIMTGNLPWKVCTSLHPSRKHCTINYMWRTSSPELIHELEAISKADDVSPPSKPILTLNKKPVNLIISPNDDRYMRFIQQTKNSLDIMQPFLQVKLPNDIQASLQQILKKGIKVRLLTNPLPAPQKISQELLDLQKKYPSLLSIHESSPTMFIHAKVLIRDKASVMAGSINWSDWSLHHNREVALMDNHPSNIKFSLKNFNALWDQSTKYKTVTY